MPAQPDKPSIAVLAFNNMSGDPEQEYFSDGISEDIITDLSKLSELHVIARNSTFTYKGKPVDVKQVGRELGVRYVLEGSVRKAGNRVRVTGQLIDAASGAHIWADRFDRDLTDIFAVQDELTQEIISALKIKLTPETRERLARKGTVNEEAFNLFLRGREQAWLHTKSGNIEARKLLGQADLRSIRILPRRIAIIGFTSRERLHQWLGRNAPSGRSKPVWKSRTGGSNDDETEPQCHYALAIALFLHRQLDRALAEARRCVALAPNSPRASDDRSYVDLQRRRRWSDRNARGLHAARSYLSGPRALFFGGGASCPGAVRRGGRDPQTAAGAQPQFRDIICSACILLRSPRQNCRKPGGLGGGAENCSEFFIEWQRRILPFKNPDDFERRIEGMRKAGLPV